jgi:hypothetical protein
VGLRHIHSLREIPEADEGLSRNERDSGEGYPFVDMSVLHIASGIEAERSRGVAVPAMALLMALESRTEAERHGGQKFTVSVVGEVRKVGQYELENGSTAFDAIVLADGFTEFASPSGLAILRLEGTRLVRILVDDDTDASADVQPHTALLQPGDMVVVP